MTTRELLLDNIAYRANYIGTEYPLYTWYNASFHYILSLDIPT